MPCIRSTGLNLHPNIKRNVKSFNFTFVIITGHYRQPVIVGILCVKMAMGDVEVDYAKLCSDLEAQELEVCHVLLSC